MSIGKADEFKVVMHQDDGFAQLERMNRVFAHVKSDTKVRAPTPAQLAIRVYHL